MRKKTKRNKKCKYIYNGCWYLGGYNLFQVWFIIIFGTLHTVGHFIEFYKRIKRSLNRFQFHRFTNIRRTNFSFVSILGDSSEFYWCKRLNFAPITLRLPLNNANLHVEQKRNSELVYCISTICRWSNDLSWSSRDYYFEWRDDWPQKPIYMAAFLLYFLVCLRVSARLRSVPDFVQINVYKPNLREINFYYIRFPLNHLELYSFELTYLIDFLYLSL